MPWPGQAWSRAHGGADRGMLASEIADALAGDPCRTRGRPATRASTETRRRWTRQTRVFSRAIPADGTDLSSEPLPSRRTRCPPPLPHADSPRPSRSLPAASPAPAAPARRPAVVARDTRELHAGLVALVPELRARALRLCERPGGGRRHRPGHHRARPPLRRSVRARHEPACLGLADPVQRLCHPLPPPAPRAQRPREPGDRSVCVDGPRRIHRPRPRPGRPHRGPRVASSTRFRRAFAPPS